MTLEIPEKDITEEDGRLYYYELLDTLNLAALIEEGVRKGIYIVNKNGTVSPNARFDLNSPWEHIKTEESNECEKWHSFMMGTMGNKVASKFIPRHCQSCWKVVVRPQTLRELFILRGVMKELDLHSKLGVERRAYTSGLYGAYFYNPTLEAGLECYRTVRKAVDESLGEDTGVIFKRGCTEYEARLGDSKYWGVPKWQECIETMVNKWIVVPEEDGQLQPEWIIANVHQNWINFAYTNSDDTWVDFSRLTPKFVAKWLKRIRPYRTYHHLVDSTPEEIEQFLKSNN